MDGFKCFLGWIQHVLTIESVQIYTVYEMEQTVLAILSPPEKAQSMRPITGWS
jgi:hypothetical protein